MNDSLPFPLEIRYTIQSRSKFLFSIQNSSLLNTYRMRAVLIILDTTSKICKYICVSDAIHSCYQTYTFVSFYMHIHRHEERLKERVISRMKESKKERKNENLTEFIDSE